MRIVIITVVYAVTLGRNAKSDCCTNPDVDPSETSKVGFNFFINIAIDRSTKLYIAQILGAQ